MGLKTLLPGRDIPRTVALGLVLSILTASCEGPPFAEAEAEAFVELEAGQSQTLQFEVEAEAIGEVDERFRVFLSQPSLAELSQLGVTAEESWEHDWGAGNESPPDRIIVEAGERFQGSYRLTLTNNSQTPVQLRVVVLVKADPLGSYGSVGGEESLKLAIRQR